MKRRASIAIVAALGWAAASTASVAYADAPDGERFELQVVGVYRPVDLSGRTVQAPREIWLRATSADGALATLIGRTLTVHRQVEVPAQVGVAGAPASQPAKAAGADDEPKVAPPAAKGKKRRVKRQPPSRAVARQRAEAAAKAKAEGRAEPAAKAKAEGRAEPEAKAGKGEADGPPPAVAVERPADAPPPPLRSPAPRVRRPAPPSIPTTRVEVLVGRVEVVEVRDQIAVARVVEDGVDAGAPSAPPVMRAVMGGPSSFVDLPAVAAGDTARLVVAPPAAPPPPPLSAEEKQALADEKQALERELRRRNSKRAPYERKVMRWKL